MSTRGSSYPVSYGGASTFNDYWKVIGAALSYLETGVEGW